MRSIDQFAVPEAFDETFDGQDQNAVFGQPRSFFPTHDDALWDLGVLDGYRPQSFQVLSANVLARFCLDGDREIVE